MGRNDEGREEESDKRRQGHGAEAWRERNTGVEFRLDRSGGEFVGRDKHNNSVAWFQVRSLYPCC